MSKRGIIFCVAWLLIIGIGSVVFKYVVTPKRQQAKQQAKEEEHKATIQMTASESHYNSQVRFGLDNFSGYAVFNTPEFQNDLGRRKIKYVPVPDSADYNARLKLLQSGDLDMATFTVDALIKTSSQLKDMPAVIVAIIDETRGADALVAFRNSVPNLDALNKADVRFVLTPDSPSETLSRVIISHFGLKNLPDNPFVTMGSAKDVYNDYRTSGPNDPKAFVLWEPYVTKMLENPNCHVLIDSSRFRGYIVDVIVANRSFLLKNEAVVQDVVEAYLRSFYVYNQANKMKQLVAEESQKQGDPLSEKQVDRLVNGIWWKNTNENFIHMGLSTDKPLQHVEDMITNITKVLISTGAIKSDPTNGQPNLLYYNKILEKLQTNNFHPGLNTEAVRKDNDDLPVLTEASWKTLVPVGTLDVPTIVFPRGTSDLTESSKQVLDELITKLKSWQQYYVVIRGNASLQGDIEANKALAFSRAKSVENYLLTNGIGKSRVKAVGVEPTGSTNVVFQLGYVSY